MRKNYFILYKNLKKLENYNKKLQNKVKIKELREKYNKILLQSRMALMGGRNA